MYNMPLFDGKYNSYATALIYAIEVGEKIS